MLGALFLGFGFACAGAEQVFSLPRHKIRELLTHCGLSTLLSSSALPVPAYACRLGRRSTGRSKTGQPGCTPRLSQRASSHLACLCKKIAWAEGWGLQGVSRAHLGLLGRVVILMHLQNPLKKESRAKGLGAEPLFWGLLCLSLAGPGLWLEEQAHLATHSSLCFWKCTDRFYPTYAAFHNVFPVKHGNSQ